MLSANPWWLFVCLNPSAELLFGIGSTKSDENKPRICEKKKKGEGGELFRGKWPFKGLTDWTVGGNSSLLLPLSEKKAGPVVKQRGEQTN